MAKMCIEVDIDTQTGAETWVFAQDPELIDAYMESLSQYMWLIAYYLRAEVNLVLFPIMSKPSEDKGLVLRNIYNIHPSELPKEFGSIVVMSRGVVEMRHPLINIVDTYKQYGTVMDVKNLFKKDIASLKVLFLGCYFQIVDDDEDTDEAPKQP